MGFLILALLTRNMQLAVPIRKPVMHTIKIYFCQEYYREFLVKETLSSIVYQLKKRLMSQLHRGNSLLAPSID